MALTQVTTNAIADDAVTTDKLANAINTARDANTAKVTNATHSGEVTGSGALTISDDTVDEANLKISNAGSNGQFLQKQSGNTGGLTWATATSVGGATGVDFNDDVKARFGTGNDLEIYHLGDVNIINAAAGTLSLRHDNETMLTCGPDAAVELYYDNSKKLETAATGVTVTGDLTATGWLKTDTAGEGLHNTDTGGKIYSNHSNDTRLEHSSNAQVKLSFYGTSSTYRGAVNADTNGMALLTGASNEEYGILCVADGATNLYHNNVKKLETIATGVVITGSDDGDGGAKGDFKFFQTDGTQKLMFDASAAALEFVDSAKATFGTGDDLQIYHDGSHSYIKDTGTGRLIIASDLLEFRNAASDETTAAFVEDGQVELYYDNNLRFKTTSSGCQLRGTSNLVETLLRPYAATGVDLGTSADRFQNLYLHGNLYLGGTGSSNAMDDYEEGDWTPDLGNMTALSFNSRTGKYTKVGRFVYASCHMNIASRTGGGGHLLLTGLPFTSHNTNASGNGFIGYSAGLTGDTYDVPTIYIGSNATQAYFYKGNGSTFASQDIDFSSGSMHITFVYESA